MSCTLVEGIIIIIALNIHACLSHLTLISLNRALRFLFHLFRRQFLVFSMTRMTLAHVHVGMDNSLLREMLSLILFFPVYFGTFNV